MKSLKLQKWHREHAKSGDYAGWRVPLWYSSVREEHLVVRNSLGLFDVSHMGEFYFEGEDSLKFLELIATNEISRPPPISGTYTLILNERGGIKDEGLIYNLGERYMLVCDAVAYEKLEAWFLSVRKSIENFCRLDLKIINKTYDLNLFSIQGPKAHLLCKKLFDIDLNEMWWFQGKRIEFLGKEIVLSKSGYTGENGFELFFEGNPLKIWLEILLGGEEFGIKPCGLATRDTLRIEAGYTLYGNETKENQVLSSDIDSINPIEAGFDKWEFPPIAFKKEFIGKEALLKQRKRGISKKLVHFEMMERGIPRPKQELWRDERVGKVTSGTQSILSSKGIGLGFAKDEVKIGDEIFVMIRGRKRKARLVSPPFYDPKKYGAFREIG
ncbi:MAG: glycine cleavage system aminomethyltransferase GcvT [Candidatus Methanofastidiosia archaeon]